MMHKSRAIAQISCGGLGAVLLCLAASPLLAEGMEGFDFDLPEYRSVWQYILLLVNLDEVVETVGFYACVMSVLLILLGLTVALRQFVWTAYTGLTAFGLVWIGFQDQNLSGIYWSGLELHVRGLILLGHVMISANFIVAGFAIVPSHPLARLKWPLVGVAVLSWAGWAYGLGRPEGEAMLIFNALATLSGLAHGLPFSTFRHLDGRPDRVLYLWAAGLAVALILVAGLVARGTSGAAVDVIFVSRLLILAITLFLVFFFIRRIRAIRRSREEAIAQTIEDARRDAQMSRALLEEQRNHSRALEIARLQKMRLATASHDIRQPIMSLRTTMDALNHAQDPAVREQLRQAFDYLDQLAESYMDEAGGEAPILPEGAAGHGETPPDHREEVSAALLMQTLERMFADEAEERGQRLCVKSEDIKITVQPLALMRILSNLTVNAIKHGTGEQVALGVRCDGSHAVFTVENSGTAPTEEAFDSFAKGDASDGAGLGLAVTRQLAENNGFNLSVAQVGDKVQFDLSVPLAA